MYARLGILALCCAVAFWLGDRIASGRYEARIADISAAIAEAQVEVVERHNQALEAERKRAASAAASRSQRRQVAQGVTHEIARDGDRSCEWRDLHRLRIEQLYAAYGFDPTGSSVGMQATVPDATIHGVVP
jgi:hypothetical protein